MYDYTRIFQQLIPKLIDIYQERVQSIILYGSVAKGTQTEESDIDIAVIVYSYTEEMYEQMTDMLVDFDLEYDKVLSVLLINYDNFIEWGNVMPFYMNIKREGKILWHAE